MPDFPATSRYRDSTFLKDGTTIYLGARPTVNTAPAMDDGFYVVRPEDDLTRVATRVFGDPRYWWVVADFNNILDPFAVLTPGAELRVPSRRRLFMEVLR